MSDANCKQNTRQNSSASSPFSGSRPARETRQSAFTQPALSPQLIQHPASTRTMRGMTSFACFIAWLFGLPPVIRLSVTAGRLLSSVQQILSARAHTLVPPLAPAECAAIERTLQVVEALVARVIWLRARQLSGLPSPARPRPLRTFPSRRIATPDRLARRAARLARRLSALEHHARRLSAALPTAAGALAPRHPALPLPSDNSDLPTPSASRQRRQSARKSVSLAPKTGPPDPSAQHIPI